MRPLNECTVVITGATNGLGRHLAVRLAGAGAHVVAHGRSPEKLAQLHDETGADTAVADLASLRDCDRLADDLATRFPHIDVLVNNAGVGFGAPDSPRALSTDGIELRFAVNYLAGYHLTRRLLPVLIASAPSRVVNVSSIGQHPIDFADPMFTRAYTGINAYRASKLAQIMFTLDLADELAATGVTVNALHPASLMDTAMVHEAEYPIHSTIQEGATATLRLITSPEFDTVTGTYSNGLTFAKANPQAYDPEARATLRTLSDDLIGQALGR